ncbi:DUF4245 family protein [Nocardioides zeae]|uniref:DUF4245 family protein n=1 Tax=Nocardioides imazamoxiresistens TaxID=3231893 RepID=A0ABU3PU85_9ACTN|nr:DUF4245 family protein [Nocardioides zeae]MDT9592794.1 DUF4245 family protein [Nocardioides zeae]
MSSTASPPPAGKPGRYNRSFAGLVTSMVVLVVAVLAFVVFRGFVRADPTVEVERFDYLTAVEAAQLGGFPVAYPAELPDGWVPTPGGYGRGATPEFSLNFLDEDDRYVGIKVSAAQARTLLQTALGEDFEEGGEVEVEASDPALDGTWQVATQEDDTALVHELPEGSGPGTTPTPEADLPYVVVVFGDLSEDELVAVAEDLTLAPVARD